MSDESVVVPGHNTGMVIREKFQEAVAYLEEIDSLREAVKAIISTLKSEHQIDPKISRQVLKWLRKSTSSDDIEFMDNARRLLETVE